MSYNTKTTEIIKDNYLYISHLDEGLQFWKLPVYPDSVSDTMASSFGETKALGRSAPVFTFSYAGPRTVTVSLKMHREMMNDINMGVSNSKLLTGEDYMDNFVRALQSIAVPKYNIGNKAVEPPIIAMRLGKEIFVKGVLSNSIGITYTKPILYNDRYAQIELSLTISEVDPYDNTGIFKNGSFRGEVSLLKAGAKDFLNIT